MESSNSDAQFLQPVIQRGNLENVHLCFHQNLGTAAHLQLAFISQWSIGQVWCRSYLAANFGFFELIIIFKPLKRFFLKFKILEINLSFISPFSFKIIDTLEGSKIRATIRYFSIGSFVITSENLSLFKALSPSFIFTREQQ